MKHHRMLLLFFGLAVMAFLIAFLVVRLSPKYPKAEYRDNKNATEVISNEDMNDESLPQ